MSTAETRTETPADPIAAYMAVEGPALLTHLNDDHDDTVLFVGRVLSGRAGARDARIVGVDGTGVTVVVTDPEGSHQHVVPFAERIDDPLQLQGALLEIVARARRQSGESGLTSIERDTLELTSIRTFLAEVSAVEEVHRHMRLVTVRGPGLGSIPLTAPDAFVYLLLPPPGRTELTIDESFTWEQAARMADDERPVGAYYTVRAQRPAEDELDLLMVLHGDEGPASAWAARAKVGDPVALWGPRTGFHPPEGTDSLLLVADETGLPALANILEARRPDLPARAVVEVANEDERLPLPSSPGIEVHWVFRNGAEPGTTALLADRVRSLDLPGVRTYVWGGGESRAMTAVRRWVRQEKGLPRESVMLVAYWRHAAGPGAVV